MCGKDARGSRSRYATALLDFREERGQRPVIARNGRRAERRHAVARKPLSDRGDRSISIQRVEPVYSVDVYIDETRYDAGPGDVEYFRTGGPNRRAVVDGHD